MPTASSSTIVTTALRFGPSVPPVGDESDTLNDSLPSAAASATTGTEKVWLVWPGSNVTDPDTAP